MPIITSMLVSTLIVACPPTIRDIQNVSNINGWNVQVVEGERKLEYIEVFSGHPSRRRALRPIEQDGSFVWRLGKEDIWVQCRYRNSAAILLRGVGKVESCRFTKAATERGLIAKAECKT